MEISSGRSHATSGSEAVQEVTAGWRSDPEIVFAFCSTEQSADEVCAALVERFPDALISGCTTSGEFVGSEHSNGSFVASAIYDSGIRWAVEHIPNISSLDAAGADEAVARLFEAVEVDRGRFEPDQMVCLLMVDGLSMSEERVSAYLAEALEGVPLAGGSAGDDLKFKSTQTFTKAGASSDAAAVVLAHAESATIKVIKHQHFLRTQKSLCITAADASTRTVIEMDGYPAAESYAAALGLKREELTDDITFLNPLTFACNGELYVRSIQSLNEDGSLTFYCGIEEGMVLHIGDHEEMKKSLERDLDQLRGDLGEADFVIGFNCILRALEAGQREDHGALGEVLMSCTRSAIGFDTYGEQLDGLHINQTLVAVAFRAA